MFMHKRTSKYKNPKLIKLKEKTGIVATTVAQEFRILFSVGDKILI